jgi:ribosomal protein S27E
MNITDKWIRDFALSVGALLLAAGLERFITAAGDSQVLVMADPLLGMPVRYAVLCVGGMEVLVGLVCLFGRPGGIQTLLLVWLMTNWAVYQAGRLFMGSNVRCACLDSMTDPLRLSGGWVAQVTALLPFYLLAGAYAVLVVTWMRQRTRRRQEYLKVACPGCGGHIEFPTEGIEWKIDCPHCGGAIRLRNLSNIA